VLRDFLRTAAEVRIKQASSQLREGTPEALEQAKLNKEVAERWQLDADSVKMVKVPVCDEVVAGG
jgi:hypothetical protein